MAYPVFTQMTGGTSPMAASNVNLLYNAVEDIMTAVAFAGYVNTETLTGDLVLDDSDFPIQFIDPGGSARDIDLPAESVDNHAFYIVNRADAAETITVKNDAGTTIALLERYDAVLFVSNGIAWVAMISKTLSSLTIDQTLTDAAIPVLTLNQADVDEDYLKIIGTSDTDADRALVDAANFTTPGAIAGWIKIYVQDDQATNPITDGDFYIPFYSVPTA